MLKNNTFLILFLILSCTGLSPGYPLGHNVSCKTITYLTVGVVNEGDGFILKVLSPRTEYWGQRAIENYTCIPLYYYLTKHFIINYSSAQVVEHSFRLNCTFEDMLQFPRKSSCSNYIFIDIMGECDVMCKIKLNMII